VYKKKTPTPVFTCLALKPKKEQKIINIKYAYIKNNSLKQKHK
jgi:hypothetical protein